MAIDHAAGERLRKLRPKEAWKTIEDLAKYKEEVEWNEPIFSEKRSPDYIDANLEQELESMEPQSRIFERSELAIVNCKVFSIGGYHISQKTYQVKIEVQRVHSTKIEKITRFPTHTPSIIPETLKPTMVHRVSMISNIEPTIYRTPHQHLNFNLKMPILHSFEENKVKYEDEDEVKIKIMGTGMDKESFEHNLYKNDITSCICHNFSPTSNSPIKPKDSGSFRIKVVKPLTIHTPPSPHVAYLYPNDMYRYYHPHLTSSVGTPPLLSNKRRVRLMTRTKTSAFWEAT
ncbi:hypothetical protein Tco_0628823 [Tanacetum coccineum]|uniref:Uncharacterized protein n=1 Tax=Tanacetum coccineum TaxID=301880 RepID=A0ABQ4WRG1_9ASTR